ncbi:MAG: tetratricopeptide repeat protein [Hellea sp.]|nr:tetratricopeptide repeat protein [Hellea sp.]
MDIREQLKLAHQDFANQDLKAAHSKTMSILKAEPGNAQALSLLSLVLRASGNFKGAHQAISEAVKIDPESAEAQVSLGSLLVMIGQRAAAGTAFKRAVEIAPTYITAIVNLGEVYMAQNDPLEALAVFEDGLRLLEGHPALLRGRAFALQASLQYEAALEQLDQLPPEPDLMLNRGQILWESERYEGARECFKLAMNHAPTAIVALGNLVNLTFSVDGMKEAQKIVDALLEENPDNIILAGSSAQILFELGDDKKAAKILSAVKAKEPHPMIEGVKANMKLAKGDADGALSIIKVIQEKGGMNAGLLKALVQALLMNGQGKEALKLIQQARQFDPQNQAWLADHITAARQIGEPYAPLYDYERLVKVYEIDAPPQYDSMKDFLGDLKNALEALHHKSDAILSPSRHAGRQITHNLVFEPDKTVQDFLKLMSKSVQDYLTHIGDAKNHPLSGRNAKKFRIARAWSVRQEGEGFHANHIHAQSWISATFFVTGPAKKQTKASKAGALKFGEPPFEAPDKDGKIMKPEHWVQSKAGRLVLFPSYMWHGTEKYKSTTPRLTLSFDVLPD